MKLTKIHFFVMQQKPCNTGDSNKVLISRVKFFDHRQMLKYFKLRVTSD